MAQIVLMSESAGRFIELGKQRLNALKLNKNLKYANAYVALQYGSIIVQKQGAIERIIIDNKPPYLIMDVFQTLVEIIGDRYIPTQGGVTGEPFRPNYATAPPELQGLQLLQSSTQYQSAGRYVYSTLSTDYIDNYCYLAVVVTDMETNNMRFVYGGYSFVNAASETFCAFAPVGVAADGGEHAAYSYRNTTGPTDPNKVASVNIVLQNLEQVVETQVWPFAGANGGYTSEIAQVLTMANAGRMKAAWFQEYENTYGPPPSSTLIHRGDDPEIVVYNGANGTYQRTKLRDLTPELEDAFAADPDAYQRLQVNKDIAYCGNNTLVIVFKYNGLAGAQKIFMFRSTNGGGTWQKINIPFLDDEIVDGGTFNLHALRSLKPGVVMLRTTTGTSVRLYYSATGGQSWTDTGVVDRSAGSRQLGKYLNSLQAVRNKFGKDYVYCTTHHDGAGRVETLTFDDFTPAASLIGDPIVVSTTAKYTPSSTRFNLAAYAERGAPMLQGYTDELEKGAL